jgi:hypothetical protein
MATPPQVMTVAKERHRTAGLTMTANSGQTEKGQSFWSKDGNNTPPEYVFSLFWIIPANGVKRRKCGLRLRE